MNKLTNNFIKNIFLIIVASATCLILNKPTLCADNDILNESYELLMVLRINDIDTIDSQDSELGIFLSKLFPTTERNSPKLNPFKYILAETLKNPRLDGLSSDPWVEMMLFVPETPGELSVAWAIPANDSEEYRNILVIQGMTEIETVDDILSFKDNDDSNNIKNWYMGWLQNKIVLFSNDLNALKNMKKIYEKNLNKNGILSEKAKNIADTPYIKIKAYPNKILTWSDKYPGVYWWKNFCQNLSSDLVSVWNPLPQSINVINKITDQISQKPSQWAEVALDIWFDLEGIYTELDLTTNSGFDIANATIDIARQIPKDPVLYYAFNLNSKAVSYWLDDIAGLAVVSTGGVITNSVKNYFSDARARIINAELEEAAIAWFMPPPDALGIGTTQLLITKWQNTSDIIKLAAILENDLKSQSPLVNLLTQMSYKIEIEQEKDDQNTWKISSGSAKENGEKIENYYTFFQNDNYIVIVGSAKPKNPADLSLAKKYWQKIAEEALNNDEKGNRYIRENFTLVGSSGSNFIFGLQPVKLWQLALTNLASWQQLAPDEPEPKINKLAREINNYPSNSLPIMVAAEFNKEKLLSSFLIPWETIMETADCLGITERTFPSIYLDKK